MNKANECTCPSGDGSLVHPCPAHPAVEQAGGDERAACNLWIAEQQLCQGSDISLFKLERNGALVSLHDLLRDAYQAGQARAALAQPSQSQYEASFEEWLANELEGEDGQPVPAAVCDITLARRAFNHWPKLEQPAKVGGVRFSAGVSSRLVVEAAQRLYEFESTPEQEAERIERLQAFREQLDPLNLAPHAETFNEAPDEALRPEQAEAEQPEVVARVVHSNPVVLGQCGPLNANDELMTVAQHAASVARWAEMFNRVEQQRDAALARVAELKTMSHNYCALLMDANAKLAELEKQEPINLQHMAVAADGELRWMTGRKIDNCELYAMPDFGQAPKLYAAPVAQAQHSVPEISGIGRDAEHPRAVVLYLRNEPSEEDMRAIQNFLRAISADVLTQAQHSVPDVCDSKEQNAFEEWASKEGMNMECHPLHWLFLDAKTYSARQGWKAALKYARNMLAAAPFAV
ncbi:TPA: hypothetical protein ACM2XW_004521 [Pseudomonas aeruginosa]|uniref:hypothetical protein n=1 Tax=Pseudomonas aeruginosa TaxID=287 RepID=UPI0030067F05